ncbi:MAG: terpene cyclase/mutase family protein [Candidatus Aenigmarchaeota archaeon]|nr:terpene cyclase/mutase family protein [Candidatus Aenigmarchaeota archaeon]
MIRIFLLALLLSVSFSHAFPLGDSNETIQKALVYLNSTQQSDGGFGDSPSAYYADLTPFAVMAIKAANQDPHGWAKNNSPIDFMKNVSVPSFNSSTVPTYYAAVIMALVASGENPDNISGRNLTNELISRQLSDGSFNGSAWITDEEWSILALVAAGYKNTSVVQNATNYLITQQKPDGGFGAFCPDASSSCPDETSLGITALITAGYETNSTAVQQAISRLKQFQASDGGIDPGWGANTDSDSWAIQAVVAAGNNFTSWAKSNYTANASSGSYVTGILTNFSINISVTNYGNNYPFDHLAKLQNSSGAFNYFKPVQDTAYAVMALLGKPFPVNNTYFNQTQSIAPVNQTFSVSINQTGVWSYAMPNTTELGLGASNTTLYIYTPSDSVGKENNVTVRLTALSDGVNKSVQIKLSVSSLCGNSVCEVGESCSLCSADCGACQTTQPAGGGGGSKTSVADFGDLTPTGFTRDMIAGTKYDFRIDDAIHSITPKVSSDAAIFEINSTPLTVTLKVNETKKVDLDGDNFYDLEIKLDKIISNIRVEVTLKRIQEPVKTCPVCPPSGEWSGCTANQQNRTSYRCSEDTSYSCVLFVDNRSCEVQNYPPDTKASNPNMSGSNILTGQVTAANIAYVAALVFIIALGLFLFYTQRH